MDQRLPSILLTAILIVLLVLGLGGLASPPAPPTTVTGSGDQETLARILARLDRLDARVDSFERSEPVTSQPVVGSPVASRPEDGRRPVNELATELAPIRAEIARLWQAVAMRVPDATPNARVDLDALRRARPNYEAIKRYIDSRNEDYERARQELMLMGQSEVANRFGRPQSMSVGDAGVRSWYYATEDDNDGFEITFLDGHVIDC